MPGINELRLSDFFGPPIISVSDATKLVFLEGFAQASSQK